MNLLHCTIAGRATRAEQRRRHLLDTARNLFIGRGFHRTGMAQIAAESGVKIGQIYRDFKSKEAIVAAIVEADVQAFLCEEGLKAAIARGDRAVVRDWIGDLIRVDEPIENCRLMSEILAEVARNDRIAEINRRIECRVRCNVDTALAALVPACAGHAGLGCLADLIMTLSVGLVMRRIADPAGDHAVLSRTAARIIDDELARLDAGDC